MTGEQKTQACAAWLRGRGVELTAGDIARGIELARGAAISGDAELEQLGAHVLAFEVAAASVHTDLPDAPPGARPAITNREPREAAPRPDAAPAALPDAAVARRADVTVAPAAELAGAPQPDPRAGAVPSATVTTGQGPPIEDVAPLTIKIRVTAPSPAVARPPAEPATATLPVGPRPRRRRLAIKPRTLALGALAAAALVAVIYGRGSPAELAPAPASQGTARAESAHRLRHLDLGVRLPIGWREASDAELGVLPDPPGSTVVFRGATAADPDHGVFVAAAAHVADPVAAARTAERGVIRALGLDAGAYHPAGCALVELGGGRAGRCRGVAEHGGVPVAVEIYVRAVGGRDVIALSLAKASQAGAAAEAAAIVGSFTP